MKKNPNRMNMKRKSTLIQIETYWEESGKSIMVPFACYLFICFLLVVRQDRLVHAVYNSNEKQKKMKERAYFILPSNQLCVRSKKSAKREKERERERMGNRAKNE